MLFKVGFTSVISGAEISFDTRTVHPHPHPIPHSTKREAIIAILVAARVLCIEVPMGGALILHEFREAHRQRTAIDDLEITILPGRDLHSSTSGPFHIVRPVLVTSLEPHHDLVMVTVLKSRLTPGGKVEYTNY